MRRASLKKGAHTAYEIWYHGVWIPKYRRKILTPRISGRLREILAGLCQPSGLELDSLALELDHLHLFLSIPPRLSVSEAIGILKSISARQMFAEFPHLREHLRRGKLWGRGYFVTTVPDSRTFAMLRGYLARQGVAKPPVKQLRLF